MDVSTVKKSTVQAVAPPKRTEPAQHAQTQEARPKATEGQTTEVAKPRPVINTQGHVTGQRLNVTA